MRLALSFVFLMWASLSFGQASSVTESVNFSAYSPWKMTFFNWSTYDMKDAHHNKGQISSYNFLAANYKFDYSSRISVNQTFFLSGAGEDYRGDKVGSRIELGDIYVQYSKYNLALLPGDVGLTLLKGRLYGPLSTGSKAKGIKTQFRGYGTLEKPFNKSLSLQYYGEFRYYFVDSRGYLAENEFYVKANKQSEYRQRITLTERINRKSGLFQSVGLKSFWYYDVPHAGIGSQIREWGTATIGGYYSLGGSVTFIASLMHEGFIRGGKEQKHDWQPFREDETTYSLMTYVRF